jgi:toxin ParE1/3/4
VAFQIVWSDSALERITQFLDFMSEENPEAARRTVEDLFARVKVLAEQPRLGRRLTEGIDPDLRRLIVGNYIVVYVSRYPERRSSSSPFATLASDSFPKNAGKPFLTPECGDTRSSIPGSFTSP